MDDVRQRTLVCNRDIAVARRDVEAASAERLIAGQKPNPTLTVGAGGYNPAIGIGPGSARNKTVDASIRFDQLLERGGKAEWRSAAADATIRAFERVLADTERRKSAAAEQLFYEAAGSEARDTLLRETLDLYRRTLEVSQRRFKVGDIAAADVTRIELDMLRAENDERVARSEVLRNKALLAQTLALPGTLEAVELAVSWPSLGQAASIEGGIDSALQRVERRADLRALQERVEAAEATRRLARALTTRDVSIGVQYDHYPASASNPNGTGNTYAVLVSIPLFLRHRLDGEIRRAEVDYYAAFDALQKAQLEARNALVRAWQDLQTARDRYRRMEAIVQPAAEKVAASAEFAFNRGASGVLDLLDARRSVRQVQIDTIAAKTEFAKTLAAWQAEIGFVVDDEASLIRY